MRHNIQHLDLLPTYDIEAPDGTNRTGPITHCTLEGMHWVDDEVDGQTGFWMEDMEVELQSGWDNDDNC